MKEAVNEEHDGKRKTELSWKIHRIHWEKNRFIYDLMYQRKVLPRPLVSICYVNFYLFLVYDLYLMWWIVLDKSLVTIKNYLINKTTVYGLCY